MVHVLQVPGEELVTEAKPISSAHPSYHGVWFRNGHMTRVGPTRTNLTQHWDLSLSYQRRSLCSSEPAVGIEEPEMARGA